MKLIIIITPPDSLSLFSYSHIQSGTKSNDNNINNRLEIMSSRESARCLVNYFYLYMYNVYRAAWEKKGTILFHGRWFFV